MSITNLFSPKISVIIPTYNRAHLIKDAVESVLNQTYQDFELIIIDYGSTDNTKEALAEYGERFQYIYQENQGRSAARNHGISLAKGKYIAFLDSDDVWFPDKLARQVPILESAPENVVLVHGYKYIVNRNLQPIPGWDLKFRQLYHLAEQGKETYENYLYSNCIFTSTILVRKTAIQEIGGYDTSIATMEDLDFYLRLLLHNYNFVFLSNHSLIKYRFHNENTNSFNSNNGYLRVYQKHLNECIKLDDFGRITHAKTLLYQGLAKTHYRLGNYEQSQNYWQKALRESWTTISSISFWKQYFSSFIRQLILDFKL